MADLGRTYDVSGIDFNDEESCKRFSGEVIDFPQSQGKSKAPAANCEVALRLANAGIAIFPCNPNKRPLFAGWQSQASSNRAMISNWWRRWPSALPAIDLAKADLIVVDCDRHHPQADGVVAFQALCNEFGSLPESAPVVRTSSGGLHFFFKRPKDAEIKNWVGKLAAGVDIKTRGGFVIAVGARLPDGRAWTTDEGGPDFAEAFASQTLPEMPDWLVTEILSKGAPKEREAAPEPEPRQEGSQTTRAPSGERERSWAAAALEGIVADLAATGSGGRNHALNAAAYRLGRMVGRGWLNEADVRAALEDACRQNRLWKDDGPSGVRATMASGLRAGKVNPHEDLAERENADEKETIAIGDEIAEALGARHRDERKTVNIDGVTIDPETGEVLDESPRVKGGGSQQGAEDRRGARLNLIAATPYDWLACPLIPPREWLYGHHHVRGFISVTGAPGGIGKSSLIIAESLSMVSGLALLHGIEPVLSLNVWIWNGEDPLVELNRRIAAAAKQYGIRREDCKGRLFVDSGRDTKIVIATRTRSGVIIAKPVVKAIKAAILGNKIDVLIIDPFVKSHMVSENDNSAIDAVATEWSDIADQTGCAVELVHHVRKTGDFEVTVEAMRGASALVSAARSARVLNQMTADESEKVGAENRRAYFRVNNGKSNMSPAPENATWFRMQSVDLKNRGPYEDGDRIGVVTEWKWPDPLDDVTAGDLRAVRTAIAKGRWRADIRAKNWVGHAVAEALGLDTEDAQAKSKIKSLIKIWIKNGALIEVEGKDDQSRVRTFVECGSDADE